MIRLIYTDLMSISLNEDLKFLSKKIYNISVNPISEIDKIKIELLVKESPLNPSDLYRNNSPPCPHSLRRNSFIEKNKR